MPISRLLQVLVALIAGLLAASFARLWLTAARDGSAGAGGSAAGMVPVLVAAASLEANQVLDGAALSLVAFPPGAVPEGSFASFEALAEVFGDAAVYTDLGLVAGEPVLASRLRTSAWPKGASSQISPGMRAVTLKADDITSIGGLIAPGDFVDLLAPGADGQTSKVIVQASRVIAVDKEMNSGKSAESAPDTLTLEVTPTQATLIVAAEQTGRLRLSLLPESEARAALPAVSVPEKMRAAVPGRKAAPAPASWTVQVTRGVEAETISLKPSAANGQ
ncbi:Flp pilus assembly protein CpaB [Hyphomonas sp.]|uniref:Flp pilus assembly protein CpaB n=1 Tax=Hyphomonas sp. TaxID=87 RepID=UPI00333E6D6C